MDTNEVGQRIRRLRMVQELGQIAFAEKVGIASGSVSKIENGRMPLSDQLVERICKVLDCTPTFLLAETMVGPTTRPWLRAYADASQRAVEHQVADCSTALEAIESLGLPRMPDSVPLYDGDRDDDHDIERFALDVRAAAQLHEDDVVGNGIRAAERLGCIVLPMREELGRHWGLSVRADGTPVICVSRPSLDPSRHVPGDRQRFTVAHEIGHLVLHSALAPPRTAEDSARIEKQANLFAGAFLVPGDAMLDELASLGGRVTLTNLAKIKEKWGVAIKALVTRFRQLDVIDADAARSLYKQISARGWNRAEPVPVGNERAIWLARSIARLEPHGKSGTDAAARRVGVGASYFERWTNWSPTTSDNDPGVVVDMTSRRVNRHSYMC
jgi:Zn-dependent peptidase ImmA (M78 family)/transcriptional regulator with XRE-family HTH domain